jgi:hypothetical protein
MGYEAMAQEALRGVVRAALQRAASPRGLPGSHHFYITFKTASPGVSVPDDLVAKYPDEMTIVLQHQYWDLSVDEDTFGVTLKFGGEPQELLVPYGAVSRFYDPSVQFLLQFTPAEPEAPARTRPTAVLPRPSEGEEGEEEQKVVSLDQFRKK